MKNSDKYEITEIHTKDQIYCSYEPRLGDSTGRFGPFIFTKLSHGRYKIEPKRSFGVVEDYYRHYEIIYPSGIEKIVFEKEKTE